MAGLGNQMSQYAAGRQAAIRNKTDLKLDLSWYDDPGPDTKREYLLKYFNISAQIASEAEIKKLKGIRGSFWEKVVATRFPSLLKVGRSYLLENTTGAYDRKFLEVRDNTYLEGWWQCEKYFKEIGETIRKELTIKTKPNAANAKMLKEIGGSVSVSLHIRRGDYVSNKNYTKFHGVCGLDYYRRAVSYLSKRVKSPVFFVFSDDPEWVKKNLKLKYPTVCVAHNLGKNDYEDIRLMSNCRHNIVANSSFSWWGAWLNPNPQKIIIAPKRWYADPGVKKKDREIVPKSWIRL